MIKSNNHFNKDISYSELVAESRGVEVVDHLIAHYSKLLYQLKMNQKKLIN